MVLLAFLFASGEHDELYARQKRQPILRLDPIKLSKGTVILKTNENGALKISVYNANQNAFPLAEVIDISTAATGTDAGTSTCFTEKFLVSPSQAQQQIPSRASKVVGIGFKAKSSADDQICSICAKPAVSASAEYKVDGTYDKGGVPVCTDLHVIVKS